MYAIGNGTVGLVSAEETLAYTYYAGHTMKYKILLNVLVMLFAVSTVECWDYSAPTLSIGSVQHLLCLTMSMPLPLNNADHSKAATPCTGGEPSPGPSCRCYSNSAGYSKCLAKSGFVPCDYDTDCGIAPPGILADGSTPSTVPSIGVTCPSWVEFSF